MHTTTLGEAIRILQNTGYCLWVGAGVTKQLARPGGVHVPDWSELVAAVERQAGVGPAPDQATYPERLDVCLQEVEREKFQQILKVELNDKLRTSIVNAARHYNGQADPIPPEIKQLARLGHRANPIVNFNIEVLSSVALAQTGGNYTIRAFNPTPQRGRVSSGGGDVGKFSRSIYHPHGAMEMYGLCVMCERDYRMMNGTLALQLAVHAAFESNLAIVGMSLEDQYLRQQISDFRNYIRTIYWFRSDPPDQATARWAWRNNVEIIIEPWPAFWTATESLPTPDELSLTHMWMGLLSRALAKPMYEHSLPFFRARTDSVNDLMPHLRLAMHQGEEIPVEILERRPNLGELSAVSKQVDPNSDEALIFPLLERLGVLTRAAERD